MPNVGDKELREFWEWCGFRKQGKKSEFSPQAYYSPSGESCYLPSIDLNNLFKYAMPKLLSKYAPIEMVAYPSNLYGYHFSVMKKYSGDHKDPALALYQAIQKARKVSK